MNEAWSVLVGVLFAAGVLLMIQRSIVFLVIGLGLVSHAVNLLLLASGGVRGGAPPILSADGTPPAGMADPLPQALILTAIVIGFGVSAFLLGLAIRNTESANEDHLDELREDPL